VHDPTPEHRTEQLLPEHAIGLAHDPLAVQATVVLSAWLEMTPLHEPRPPHWTRQLSPEHAIGPAHELLPAQLMSQLCFASHVMVPEHEPPPTQRTAHVDPPQWTLPTWSTPITWQLLA
jgi:hypothetical protein